MVHKSRFSLKPIIFLSIFLIASILGAMFGVFLTDNLSQAAAPSISNIYPKIVSQTAGGSVNLEGAGFEFSQTNSIITSDGGDVEIIKTKLDSYQDNEFQVTRTDMYVIGEFSGSVTVDGTTYNSNGGKDIFVQRIKEPSLPIAFNGEGSNYFRTFGSAQDDNVTDLEFYDSEFVISGSVSGNTTFTGLAGNSFDIQTTNQTGFLISFDKYLPRIESVETIQGDDNQIEAIEFNRIVDNSIGSPFDAADDLYVTGSFENTITLPDGTNLTSNGGKDVFHYKYRETFEQLTISTFETTAGIVNTGSFGGVNDDMPTDIIADSSENYTIAGNFVNTINLGTSSLSGNSNLNGFVAKFDESNNELWSVKGESNGTGSVAAKSISEASNGIAVGYNTNSPSTFTGQANFTHSPSTEAAAIINYDSNGNFVSGVNIDGPGADSIHSVSGASVLGTFENTLSVDQNKYENNGNLLPPASVTSNGGKDVFYASFDVNNGGVGSIANYGGSGDQFAAGIEFDSENTYIYLNYFGNTTIDGNSITTSGNDYAILKAASNPNSATLGGEPVNISYKSPTSGNLFIPPNFPSTGWQDLVITNNDSTTTTINDAIYIFNNGSLARQTLAAGKNDSGQLGQGVIPLTDNSFMPIILSGLVNPLEVQIVRTGKNHSFVMTQSGDLYGWGDNTYGQLGTGDNVDRDVPTQITFGAGISNFWAVGDSTFVRLNNGDYMSFGRNDEGQLGNGTFVNTNTPTLMTLPTFSPTESVFDIVGGPNFGVYITNEGRLATWGNNDYGQLGRGTVGVGDPTPTHLSLGSSQFKRIAAGTGHVIAVDAVFPSANLWSWGKNDRGQLGDGTTTDNPTPTMQNTLTDPDHLTAANDYSVATNSARDLFVWGDNTSGQQGDGTVGGFVATPQQVPISFNIRFDTTFDLNYVSAGGYDNLSSHILVVDDNDSVWAWGDNTHGQLGISRPYMRLTPTRVSEVSSEIWLAKAGGQHSVFSSPNINPAPIAVPDTASINEGDTLGVAIDVLANDSDQECFNGGVFNEPTFNYLDKIFNFGSIDGNAQTCDPCPPGGMEAASLYKGMFGLLFGSIDANAQCGPLGGTSGGLIPLSLSNSTVTISTPPANGTITNIDSGTGVVTYVPNPDFSGTETFGYTVQDDQLRISNEGIVIVTVAPQQDRPTVNSFIITTPEGVNYQFTIADFQDNFNDIDGDSLNEIRIDTVPNPAQGSLLLNGVLVTDGQQIARNDILNLVYRPATGFSGDDTFTWNGSDGIDYALTNATVFVDVNGRPDAMDDSASTPVNGTILVDVLDNDTDPENDALEVCNVNGFTQGSNGTVVLDVSGQIRYTPNPGYVGSDTFTYDACDIFDGRDTATVTITVVGVNNAPSVSSFTVNTPKNIDYIFDISDFDNNFSDPESNQLDRVRIDSLPNDLNGELLNNNVAVTASDEITRGQIINGDLVFRPVTGFTGAATFDWNGSDSILYAATNAVVTVNVTNNLPTVSPVNISTTEGVDYVFQLSDFTNSYNDVNNDPLDSIRLDTLPNIANGVLLRLNDVPASQADVVTASEITNGNFVFRPASGFVGSTTFDWNGSDGTGFAATNSVVNISVNPFNNNPAANDDDVDVDEDSTITIDVLDNDTDPDTGDTLSICTPNGFTQPSNGTVTQVGDNLVYTPNANYTGSDAFTYRACDGNGGEDTATVTITVNPINDNPDANDDDVEVNEDGEIDIPVLDNDTDPDGDTLTICDPNGFTQGTNGVVTRDGDNLIYTPNDGFTGDDTFTYRACDGNSGEDTASVNVTVVPLPNLPRTGGFITTMIWVSTALLGVSTAVTIKKPKTDR